MRSFVSSTHLALIQFSCYFVLYAKCFVVLHAKIPKTRDKNSLVTKAKK